MQHQQLLDLFNHEYDFNSFIAAGNEMAVVNLQSYSTQYTHIYGANLSGKTHLLKAWTNLANTKYRSAIYYDICQPTEQQLADLDLESFRFIAIDNIDCLSLTQQIELFDLFNHIKLNNRDNYLLTSSTHGLNQCELREDLKTRIQSGLIFALKSLNESELLSALSIYTKREGIKFGEAELSYILSHYPRNLGQQIKVINTIAALALSAKRQITIPFIRTACPG